MKPVLVCFLVFGPAAAALADVTGVTDPAYFGTWGFYQLPHGDPEAGIHDGWVITNNNHYDPLFAIGGWFVTNTFGARMNFIVDGTTVVDFEDHPLGYAHQFYGIVVTEGFDSLEIVETESTPGDEWYYIFADAFTVAIDRETATPSKTPAAIARLLPNVPNPFNPRTVIAYELDVAGPVDLRVHDARGRLVRILAVAIYHEAGSHRLPWDGRDDGGRALPAGVYRCDLVAGDARAVRWLTLAK